jgi:hypothetical protein
MQSKAERQAAAENIPPTGSGTSQHVWDLLPFHRRQTVRLACGSTNTAHHDALRSVYAFLLPHGAVSLGDTAETCAKRIEKADLARLASEHEQRAAPQGLNAKQQQLGSFDTSSSDSNPGSEHSDSGAGPRVFFGLGYSQRSKTARKNARYRANRKATRAALGHSRRTAALHRREKRSTAAVAWRLAAASSLPAAEQEASALRPAPTPAPPQATHHMDTAAKDKFLDRVKVVCTSKHWRKKSDSVVTEHLQEPVGALMCDTGLHQAYHATLVDAFGWNPHWHQFTHTLRGANIKNIFRLLHGASLEETALHPAAPAAHDSRQPSQQPTTAASPATPTVEQLRVAKAKADARAQQRTFDEARRKAFLDSKPGAAKRIATINAFQASELQAMATSTGQLPHQAPTPQCVSASVPHKLALAFGATSPATSMMAGWLEAGEAVTSMSGNNPDTQLDWHLAALRGADSDTDSEAEVSCPDGYDQSMHGPLAQHRRAGPRHTSPEVVSLISDSDSDDAQHNNAASPVVLQPASINPVYIKPEPAWPASSPDEANYPPELDLDPPYTDSHDGAHSDSADEAGSEPHLDQAIMHMQQDQRQQQSRHKQLAKAEYRASKAVALAMGDSRQHLKFPECHHHALHLQLLPATQQSLELPDEQALAVVPAQSGATPAATSDPASDDDLPVVPSRSPAALANQDRHGSEPESQVLFQPAPTGQSYREKAADKAKELRRLAELACTHVYAVCDGESEDNSRWRPCRHVRTKTEGEYIATNGDVINLPPAYIQHSFPRCGTTAPKHRKRVHRLTKEEVDSLHEMGVPPCMDGEWPQARLPQYAPAPSSKKAGAKRMKLRKDPYPKYVEYVPQAAGTGCPPHNPEDGRISHPLDQPPLPLAATATAGATPSLFINGVPYRRWLALKPAPAKKLTAPEMLAIIRHGEKKTKPTRPPTSPPTPGLDVPATAAPHSMDLQPPWDHSTVSITTLDSGLTTVIHKYTILGYHGAAHIRHYHSITRLTTPYTTIPPRHHVIITGDTHDTI